MGWVRNPWWDGFWLLSGLPIGIALMLLCPPVPPQRIFALATAIMILETGHVVSPMILAWSKPGLRQILYREWGNYLLLPWLLVAGCLLLPWPIVFGVYFAWNIWHFGMQIFGVTCMYKKPSTRDEWLFRAFGCLSVTAFCIGILPFLGEDRRVHMLSFGIFSFNHWLADIGLSSRASGWRWGFIPLVLAIGVAWLLLRNGPLSVQHAPQILAIRAAIGMIHFVYSARVWKFSDPRVRETIGADFFRKPHGISA
jgi:hypothetical protein